MDIMTPGGINDALTRVPGSYQRKRWSLYDRQTYTSGTTQSQTYFQEKVGATATKTRQKTNMAANGSLPANNFFAVYGIQVSALPALNPSIAPGAQAAVAFVNDVWLLGKNGVLEFTVDSKQMLIDAPLMKFPAQHRLDGFAALAEGTTAAADKQSRLGYASFAGPLYKVDPFVLEPMQAFAVNLTWPDGAVTLAGGNPELQIDLVGVLFSPN
ncbi:MAG TPA: hypothetical protein VEC14_01070 [Reyranellaceae bacterium]|nr:hypothetical protein [Reyranellaceae bacterium]